MRSTLTFLLLFTVSSLTAQKNITILLRQLKSTAPGPLRLKLYKDIGTYYEPRQMDSAVYYISEGLKSAEQLRDSRAQALFMLQLGTINEKHGNGTIALKLVNEALTTLRKINDKEGMAMAYMELGLLEGKRSDDKGAGTDFDHALKFFIGTRDTMGIVQTYSDLGEIYENRGDTARALDYYLRALKQYGNIPPSSATYFHLLDHIGQLYIQKGNVREALRYLQEGVRRSHGDAALADTETELLDEEGKAYERLGEKKKALDFYKLELQRARQYQLPFDQAKALVSIAGILKSQNAKSSLNDLQQALNIAASLKDKQLAANIYKAMAGIYRQEKNYKEALMTLDEHHRLLDSLFGVDKARELAGLDSSYELIESREQVENLTLANKEKTMQLDIGIVIIILIFVSLVLLYFYFRKVRKLNRDLAVSNNVKDKLFSVLGHDLRGPIGATVQLSELMMNGDIDPVEQKQLIVMLQKQSESTLAVLESVLKWGQVQLQGVRVNPESLHPAALIQKNLSLLQAQADAKQVTLITHIDPQLSIMADPDHFELVIRNLVSNAIKFSQAGGQVEINASRKDRDIVFSVKDKGIGISAEKLKQFAGAGMESSFGTKGEKGTGLGLLLVKEFVSAGGGEIWAESTEGEGTTFFFTVVAD
ncbi:MAG: ATP-binding protein [Bacteroidota bacterium]